MHVTDHSSPIVPKLKGIHLFHYDGAPCAQRVRFALHEKGLVRGREVRFDADDEKSCRGEDGAWVSRVVSLAKLDHMTPAYALIQPNLVVPALVHDGQLHIESMEIIEYLDGAFGGTPLMPIDPEVLEDAKALTCLGEELHRSIRFVTFRWGLRGLARLNSKQENALRELLTDADDGEQLVDFYQGYNSGSIPEAAYLSHLQKLLDAFKDLDARMSDGRAFLTGDAITMADVIWAMKTLRLLECDFPFADILPNYHAWYQGVSARPSFQEGVMARLLAIEQ